MTAAALRVQIDQLPSSVEGFVALRDQVSTTPQGGAAMMVVALLAYASDEKLGQQCLTIAVDRDRLVEGSDGYKGWQLGNRDLRLVRDQLADRVYLPRSYIEGTTPENGYQLPDPPHTVAYTGDPRGDTSEGTLKIFVASSGASSPRPVKVKVNARGIWKASEWSSLLVGIRAPVDQTPDDL